MAKNNEFMHVTNAVQSLLYSDHSLYHKNLISAKKYFISRLTSGLQIFKIEFPVPILDLLDQKMASY